MNRSSTDFESVALGLNPLLYWLALIEPKSKRSANVTTLNECTCFYLPLKILDSIHLSRKEIIEVLLKNLALLLIKRLKDCNSKINNILER